MSSFPILDSLPTRRLIPALAVLAGLALSGCGSPSEVLHDPEPRRELVVKSYPESSGILSPLTLRAWVTDAEGNPVPGARVDWTVRSGGGFLGEWTNLSGPRNAADAASTIADSTGLARIQWGLGPLAGAQRVSISTDSAADVVLGLTAHPGVVLVAVWNPKLTSAHDLPSDTIRIHATGLSADEVQEARGWLNDGKVVRLRTGYIRAGVGIDPNWVFHLDQALVRLAFEPMLATECVLRPPLTQAEVDYILTSPNSAFVCPWDLGLVGIEDVPAEYLDALAGG